MPQIAAVILAAGESSRLGQPKQLLQFRGKSLLRRVVDAARDAACSPIAVVVGSRSIERDLRQSPARIVENENWQTGIGSSIRAGVQSLVDDNEPAAAVILLACDQPFVDARVIKQMIAIREKTNKPIAAASYSGTLGIPALFDHSCFEELLALSDNSGAKPIILRDPARVAEFDFPAGQIDIDTMEDYDKLK